MARRTRTRLTRAVGVSVAAVAAVALVGACGSDDSTASGSATTSASTTASASASPSGSATGEASHTGAPTSPGEAATAPPATPDAPEGFPGPVEQPADPNGQAFLDGLRGAGITPSGDGATALDTARYICSAQDQGGNPDDVRTIVTAMVGSDAQAGGQQMTDEQAGQNADTFIRVANETYCS